MLRLLGRRRSQKASDALLGALPTWGHNPNWGYAPSGGLGLIMLILVALVLLGLFPF